MCLLVNGLNSHCRHLQSLVLNELSSPSVFSACAPVAPIKPVAAMMATPQARMADTFIVFPFCGASPRAASTALAWTCSSNACLQFETP